MDVDVATIAVGTPARAMFEADFSKDVATMLSIEVWRIVINSIRAGSAVVDFSIRADSSGTPISTAKVTTSFNRPGIAIAGAKTTTAVTAASVTAVVVPKAPMSVPVTGMCTGNTDKSKDVICPMYSSLVAKKSGKASLLTVQPGFLVVHLINAVSQART
eukprot:SAG25_NODE_6117_length_586_cov_3.642710_1_plen_160_part_00